jgi:hypothetical protein
MKDIQCTKPVRESRSVDAAENKLVVFAVFHSVAYKHLQTSATITAVMEGIQVDRENNNAFVRGMLRDCDCPVLAITSSLLKTHQCKKCYSRNRNSVSTKKRRRLEQANMAHVEAGASGAASGEPSKYIPKAMMAQVRDS